MSAMEVDQTDNTSPVQRGKPYELINQKVELTISFDRTIRGRTSLTIFPEYRDIRGILLNARQCEITKATVNGFTSDFSHDDPCDKLNLHTNTSVHQHHVLHEKLSGSLNAPPDQELYIPLPDEVTIKENKDVVVQTADGVQTAHMVGNSTADAEAAENLTGSAVSKFTPLEVVLEFTSRHTRDVLQFATGPSGSGKWPHVYTRGGFLPGRASCLFPCLDSLYYRCPWEISITGPRTVGDALRQIDEEYGSTDLSEDARAYAAKEMVFVCPGEITDDVVSKTDRTQRTVSYAIIQNVSAQHIGFAIGPFEKVDLGSLREAKTLELLQENAAPIWAYCLPGRSAEAENTCLPTTDALDYFVSTHAPYPFASFSYCFVDDHPDRPAAFAGLALCSSRMLYPENVIDTAKDVTRSLIHALTTQWLGVQIVAKQPEDTWVVLGSAIYLAELSMKELCGNNEYRFRMKQLSDRVCELDHQRPSLWDMGALLHIDPAEYEFLALKAPLVLYILDRRIVKMLGSPKMSINIGKFMSKARNEDLKDNLLSTQEFCKVTEKVLHSSIDDFINQWVKGAGCPTFFAQQKFNKKKLVIEMTIRQQQAMQPMEPELHPDTFMRDVREEFGNVYAASPQHVFTGPMTIRIHEADGTPYEHIIQIKEAVTKVEVPYNTKYKRLKRSKKQRQKAAARAENDDEQEPSVYALGDVLQTDEEIAAWQITDWSEEDYQRMNTESYEWIRIDADFEWICTYRLIQPGFMFASQLQQDRDVAAQLLSVQAISQVPPSRLSAALFLRTMMDDRYFHGVRREAILGLVKHASNENSLGMIGLNYLRKAFEELYCTSEGDSVMTRPNNFSDQLSYYTQTSLIEAISKVRDENGQAPYEVKKFLRDQLRFNDNSQNEYSDAHYVANLIKALTYALLGRPVKPADADLDEDFDQLQYWADLESFERSCLEEIDRYRRMDEWTSSYQNLYSRTALECQSRLTAAGVGRFSNTHFFQYIRPGNYEMLRAQAYDILVSHYMFSNGGILHKVVHGMVANNSAYVRDRIRSSFGKALARRAFSSNKAPIKIAATNGLVVENTTGTENTGAATVSPTSSIEAALDALKKELASDFVLQTAFEEVLGYPEAGYEDVGAINDFCRMIYPAREQSRVTLSLPRYWKTERVSKYKFKFSRTSKVRMKQVKRWKPKEVERTKLHPITITRPMAEPQRKGSTLLKLKVGGGSQQKGSALSAASTASKNTPTPPPAAKPKISLKLGRPSH